MERNYRGKRYGDCGDVRVWVVEGDAEYPLKHQVRHSPDGFEWGYGGSGPADLARSLCWDLLGYEPHPAIYQEIKFRFVAGFGDEWTLTERDLRAAIEQAAAAHAYRTEN